MANNSDEKAFSGKSKVLYAADQTPPPAALILSALQHTLLALSLGMSVPVAVARAAGLDLTHSSALLAAAFFAMGIATILQTIPGKVFGSGYQSVSTCDTAAISACVLAAELGGVPLVLGMTVFGCILRFVMGSFSFRMRKLFPPEVTGTMVFILGINLVPTGFKYFLGAADAAGVYDYRCLIVAGCTLLFMLACALFLKPLKPYTGLAGIVFGYILSIAVGIFDLSSLAELSEKSAVGLPIYPEFSFAFDARMIAPFGIISLAAVVDNIGDFSACQAANDPGRKKPDWHSIERGIRGGSIGTMLPALIGGLPQSTATTNIGIAGAAGITSRAVAYLAGAMLMAVSFFPGIAGVLCMIPSPVLGAVLIYSMCYIMAGGFSTLAARVLDDRRIFTIFLSVGASASTLIPGLYDFMPENVRNVLATPMVMGVCVLLLTTLLGRIGTKKTFTFVTGVGPEDLELLDKKLEDVCREWAADRTLLRKLQLALNALCEGIYEISPEAKLHFTVRYDQLQVRLHVETDELSDENRAALEEKNDLTAFSVALAMLSGLFDSVSKSWEKKRLSVDVDADM